MMTIDIPEIPAGIMTVLGLLTPPVVAIVNGALPSTGSAKRLLSIVVSLILAAAAILIYFAATDEDVPNVAQLVLLALVVSQASYATVTKRLSRSIEHRVGALTGARVAGSHRSDAEPPSDAFAVPASSMAEGMENGVPNGDEPDRPEST